MNKQDLINRVTLKLNLNKYEVKEVVEAAFDEIILALNNKEDVNIPTLGKFEVKDKKGRDVIIPNTDTTVKIPSHKIVTFRVSKVLKNHVK